MNELLEKVRDITSHGYDDDYEGLQSALSDLLDEYEYIKEDCERRIHEVEDEVQDYYKPRSSAELYGISDKDFL